MKRRKFLKRIIAPVIAPIAAATGISSLAEGVYQFRARYIAGCDPAMEQSEPELIGVQYTCEDGSTKMVYCQKEKHYDKDSDRMVEFYKGTLDWMKRNP